MKQKILYLTGVIVYTVVTLVVLILAIVDMADVPLTILLFLIMTVLEITFCILMLEENLCKPLTKLKLRVHFWCVVAVQGVWVISVLLFGQALWCFCAVIGAYLIAYYVFGLARPFVNRAAKRGKVRASVRKFCFFYPFRRDTRDFFRELISAEPFVCPVELDGVYLGDFVVSRDFASIHAADCLAIYPETPLKKGSLGDPFARLCRRNSCKYLGCRKSGEEWSAYVLLRRKKDFTRLERAVQTFARDNKLVLHTVRRFGLQFERLIEGDLFGYEGYYQSLMGYGEEARVRLAAELSAHMADALEIKAWDGHAAFLTCSVMLQEFRVKSGSAAQVYGVLNRMGAFVLDGPDAEPDGAEMGEALADISFFRTFSLDPQRIPDDMARFMTAVEGSESAAKLAANTGSACGGMQYRAQCDRILAGVDLHRYCKLAPFENTFLTHEDLEARSAMAQELMAQVRETVEKSQVQEGRLQPVIEWFDRLNQELKDLAEFKLALEPRW